MPRSTRSQPRSGQGRAGRGQGSGWAGVMPVLGLCALALIGSAVAFNGRGGTEARTSSACLIEAAPGRFANWDAFFRRYPFEDDFLKGRIRDANGYMPGPVIVIPLEAGTDCSEVLPD